MTDIHPGRTLGHATMRELASGLDGTLVTPGDPDYEDARHIWNHMIDKRPAAIVRAASVDDVVRAVSFAGSEGLPVAVRCGGHSIAGFSTCDDGLVIDLGALSQVTVDPEKQTAVVGGGASWGTIDAATQKHNLATVGGLVSSTGIGGFATGGGIGHLSRKYGLTCDNVLSVEIVTADGQVLHASEGENSDLFWAVRGGGGNFGVITSFEMQLYPLGPLVLGGFAWFPAEEAAQVIARYRDATAKAPDELTVMLALDTAAPAPFLPESVHFKKIVACGGLWAGRPEDGEKAIAPFRELGTPIADIWGPMPYVGLQSAFDPFFGRGAANYFTSAFMDDIPAAAADDLVEFHRRAADFPVQTELHLHHMGGAISRVPADATAFHNRTSPYIFNVIARTESAADLPPHVEWARAARDAMAVYGPGDMYVNFTGEADEVRTKKSYPAGTYARLQKVKDAYDPTNMFRFNQNIRPSR
jgi:FAD/FMN-containing dehydrogenase